MERTGLKKVLNKVFQIALPLVLGAAILLWTYHDFDFRRVWSVLAFFLIRNLTVFAKVRGILNDVWAGCLSLRHVKHPWLFAFYTVGIWACYFLQFYVSFYCFDFSASLGWMPGLVMFVVGSIAVAVPTPNGAGPWHFAVITMMMMYGVGKEDAGIFALLVHGIQTFLLILLGVYGLVALPLVNKKRTGK